MMTEFNKISLHDAYVETFKHSGEFMIKPVPVAAILQVQGLDPKTPPGMF